MVAALNHFHICALHDVGEAAAADAGVQASIRFLVMEHLEGQTLADRLLRGALPMADVSGMRSSWRTPSITHIDAGSSTAI